MNAERLLAELDPARPQPPTTGSTASPEDRAEILRTILDTGSPPARTPVARRPRRRLVLAAAALVAASAATVVLRPEPAPVYAATPPMLRYARTADAPAAADLLRRIADAAQRSTPRGTGAYEYLHLKRWQLTPPPLTGNGWRVEPSEDRMWWHARDGSGRSVGRWQGTEQEHTYGPGQAPRGPDGDMTDPATLRRVLLIDGSHTGIDTTGRMSPLGMISALAALRLPAPEVRAAMWRVLGDVPGLTYTGRTTDRAGRTGEAFSLEYDAKTGPTRDTLIIDPERGELLGFERTLHRLTDPDFFDDVAGDQEPIRLRTPAVIGYTVILAAELRPTTN